MKALPVWVNVAFCVASGGAFFFVLLVPWHGHAVLGVGNLIFNAVAMSLNALIVIARTGR